MGFLRTWLFENGLPRKERNGDGYRANALVTLNAAAGAQNITVPAILGGVAMFTGAAGAVAYTLPTAAALIAALPDMDIGDCYHAKLLNTTANAATITTNTGLTLSGLTAVTSGSREMIFRKTSSTTMDVICL